MKILTPIFVFYFSLVTAQNFTVIYEFKYKPNVDKEFVIENYYLDVLNDKSVFRSENNRYSDSLKSKTGLGSGQKPYYNNQFDVIKDYSKNITKKVIISPLFRDVYFIKPDKLDWKILQEKTQIGEFECQKAELNYGGRNWTAWFTTNNPISDGPYVFDHLPGLIVKIFDDKFEFNFEITKLRKNNWDDLYETKNGTDISWETFRKLQLDYYEQPFSELKARNIPMGKNDDTGNPIRMNSSEIKVMENSIKKTIKGDYNPLEINQKVHYK